MLEAIIGLECHAQLATASKLFCTCRNADGQPPNTDVCPLCLGHPGTLPVLNARAVHLAIKAALATSCTVHERSIFARKQYFYPDLPKGYQISQYEEPIATGGALHVDVEGTAKVFGITRIHLEEDAGKSIHGPHGTGVDFNRAGTPLAEIVSEPELHSPADAEAYLRTMHRVLVEAGVTLGDMEKGHFRCDANVSLHRPGEPFGTRVEIKNLNSFRFVAKALAYEIDRQRKAIAAGEPIVQETRMWRGNQTLPMRGKEGSSDYRYFPDPDLPPLEVTEAMLAAARGELPGVPLDRWLAEADGSRLESFASTHGLSPPTAALLIGRPELVALLTEAVAAGGPAAEMANWLTGDVARRFNESEDEASCQLTGSALAALHALVEDGTLSRGLAREVLDILWVQGGDPRDIAAARGLVQVGDEALLRQVVSEVITAHPKQLARYKDGNTGMVGFFMGQVMRATQGKAEPALARRLVVEALDGL